MTRYLYLLITCILVLLVPTPLHAVPVADIQTRLNRNEALTVNTTVSGGEIFTEVSTSQGVLKFIIRQGNNTLLDINVRATAGMVNNTLDVTAGEIEIFMVSTENFIPSDVTARITQEDRQTNFSSSPGLIVGAGVLLVLLLPFVYMFGRYQGQTV